MKPLSYNNFLNLLIGSKIILTDSGGIQEEASVLNIPCLTLRNNTERPMTIAYGTNQLVNLDKKSILSSFDKKLNNFKKRVVKHKVWDGRSADRISKTIIEILKD